VHDDLVDREFRAPALNAVWLIDITEHPTGEGKLYLCAIKDTCSNRIVGYSMDARMTAALAVSALRNAVALRSPAETIVHSDRSIWAALVPAVTTPPWNRSSPCCRRTSSQGDHVDGAPYVTCRHYHAAIDSKPTHADIVAAHRDANS
jgi:hypothetical protein